jgi:hypothetical protein
MTLLKRADVDSGLHVVSRRSLLAPTPSELRGRAFGIYEKARNHGTWNPRTDIAWEQPSRISRPLQDTAWNIASQGVYAEQAGLITAARLLLDVDDVAIRFCLATAVSDEAKHSEVFARYALRRGAAIAPDNEAISNLFDGLEDITDPYGRFVVHTMLEGMAADEFHLFMVAFEGDVLADIYRYISRDEARHVAMGMDYLATFLRMPEHAHHGEQLERYGREAVRLSGLTPTAAEWLGRLVGRDGEEVWRWFLSRHNGRIRRLGSQLKEASER